MPDPLLKPGLHFEPVFDYEQVLLTGSRHPLAQQACVRPEQLAVETLITYPVSIERLDIYTQFLMPAGIMPRRQKIIETTDIMVQMVASGRGVAALPRWLAQEYATRLDVVPLRLGRGGIQKQIFLGLRQTDREIDYLQSFVTMARGVRTAGHPA